MGLKRFFSRVVRKLKNVERPKADSAAISHANATDETPEISDPTIHPDVSLPGPDPASMQVVLWQPPVLPVPLFVPIVSSHRHVLIPPLVRTAAALALGCPPTIAAQPLVGLYSLLRYSNRLEHDLMLQILRQSAHASTTVRSMETCGPTPDEESSSPTSEIRYLVADPALAHLAPMQKIPPGAYGPRQLPPPKVLVNPQPCLRRDGESSRHGPEIRCLVADPALATFAPRQVVPAGAYEAVQAVSPAVCMPSLAWSGKTTGTLEISTPKIPRPDLGTLPKKIPRYPPGLGYPEDDAVTPDIGTTEVAYVPTPVLQPTLPCRPNLLNSELSTPTQDGASPATGKARYEKYMVQTSVVRMKAGMYRYKFTRPVGAEQMALCGLARAPETMGLRWTSPLKSLIDKTSSALSYQTRTWREYRPAKGKKYLEERAVYAGSCAHNEFDAWLAVTYECHPFLTPLIDCFSDDKNIYFIMRYYPENLRQRASNKACSLQLWQIRLIAAEMALGLEKLHDIRIMHNDLKLENILVTPNGHDEWNGKTMSGKAGTDGYLAPEQFVGDSTHNYKADIYAFGLMVLDLFMPSGTPWYEYVPDLDLGDDDDIDRSLFEHGQPDPRQAPVMDQVYDHLAKDLLTQILHPNPAKRPGWNDIKRHPFFTSYLDWARVLAREYDTCYRACSRRQKVKPIVRPSCWVRQRRDTRAADAIHRLLQRSADADSIGALNIQAPRGLGWIDKRHGVACRSGRDRCLCDFPMM
ncbi:hypothetical protein EDC04DRAFT_3143255 [Pisolithus marmoratus]|nr:hypothetical protein EDC04DRAFT_3143255 [Pisolithus marmoratus]